MFVHSGSVCRMGDKVMHIRGVFWTNYHVGQQFLEGQITRQSLEQTFACKRLLPLGSVPTHMFLFSSCRHVFLVLLWGILPPSRQVYLGNGLLERGQKQSGRSINHATLIQGKHMDLTAYHATAFAHRKDDSSFGGIRGNCEATRCLSMLHNLFVYENVWGTVVLH